MRRSDVDAHMRSRRAVCYLDDLTFGLVTGTKLLHVVLVAITRQFSTVAPLNVRDHQLAAWLGHLPNKWACQKERAKYRL